MHFAPRTFKSFRAIGIDAGHSRFYAGIHFKTDDEVGLKMGAAIGKYVVDTWMKQ